MDYTKNGEIKNRGMEKLSCFAVILHNIALANR